MAALINFRQWRILGSEPYSLNPGILIDRSNFIYPVPAFEKLGLWKDRNRIALPENEPRMREYTYLSLNEIDERLGLTQF
jgi:hypothetical protein